MTTVPVELPDDQIVSSGYGFIFQYDNEVLTIDADIIVGSTADTGVYDGVMKNSSVFNYGTVFGQGGAGDGIQLAKGNSTVTNEIGAFVRGAAGVRLAGNGDDTVVNAGGITGTDTAVAFQGNAVKSIALTNSGQIYGSTGVLIAVDSVASSTIENSGTIAASNGDGIVLQQGATSTTTIVNQAGGLIQGGDVAIYNQTGTVVLTNNGKLVGGFLDQNGTKDVITNNGSITGSIGLSTHADTFKGQGSRSAVSVYGNGGKDRLIGGAHADTLDGGLGDDTLTGGGGKDHFLFANALSTNNVDSITDFKPGTDIIELTAAIFGGIGSSQGSLDAAKFSGNGTETSTTRIVYDPATGSLSYDSNGSKTGHLVQFATLAEHPSLHNTDVTVMFFD